MMTNIYFLNIAPNNSPEVKTVTLYNKVSFVNIN